MNKSMGEVFAEDMQILEDQEKEQKERRGRRNRWRPHQGSKNGFFFALSHPDMGGRIYQPRGTHYRCGSEGKNSFTCLRDLAKEPISQCPQCEKNASDFDSSNKARIEDAKKRIRRQSFIFGGIDMSSFVDEKGMPIPEAKWTPPPKCFGNYIGDENAKSFARCQKCVEGRATWGRTCMNGVCTYPIGKTLFPTVATEYQANGDFTDLDNPKFVVVKQEGQDKSGREKYSVLLWKSFTMPKLIKAWIKANLIDLKNVYPPKSVAEVKAIMEGIEYEEGLEDADLPKCFADAGIFDATAAICKACEAFKMCQAEIAAAKKAEAEVEEEEEAAEPEKEAAEPEESESEEEVEVDLSKMDRKELKAFIAEQELDITVYKNMSDDDVRDAILEKVGGSEEPEEEAEPEVEKEEPEVEEEELEEELVDPLDSMDRSELKKYISSNNLGVKVFKNMSDNDIRDAIRAAFISEPNAEEEPEEEIDSDTETSQLEKEILKRKMQREKAASTKKGGRTK